MRYEQLRFSRRQLLVRAAALGSAAAIGAGALPAIAQQAPVIRLALGPRLSYSTKFWAALEFTTNKFSDFGVQVEGIEYPSVQAAIAGTLAGAADVFYSDFILGVGAIANGQKLTLVSPGNEQIEFTYFLKRGDDNSITSPQDLRGKKIAVATSDFTHVYTIEWLRSIGLTAALGPGADVELVEIPANHAAALSSGAVDVVHNWDRLAAYQRQIDFKFAFVPGTEGGVPVDSFLSAPGSAVTAWYANAEFNAQNPDLIEKFDKAARLVSQWFSVELSPAEQRDILTTYVRTDFTPLIETLDQGTLDSLITLRERVYPVEGFNIDAASAWMDLVASLRPGRPTSQVLPLREHSAAHLLR